MLMSHGRLCLGFIKEESFDLNAFFDLDLWKKIGKDTSNTYMWLHSTFQEESSFLMIITLLKLSIPGRN